MSKAIAGLFAGIGIGLIFALVVAGILLVNYINNRYPVITTQPTTQLQNHVIEQPVINTVIQERQTNTPATATAEQLAACAAARTEGRRLAPYCPPAEAPGVGR